MLSNIFLTVQQYLLHESPSSLDSPLPSLLNSQPLHKQQKKKACREYGFLFPACPPIACMQQQLCSPSRQCSQISFSHEREGLLNQLGSRSLKEAL